MVFLTNKSTGHWGCCGTVQEGVGSFRKSFFFTLCEFCLSISRDRPVSHNELLFVRQMGFYLSLYLVSII